MKRYEVEMIEHVRTVVYVEAASAKDARDRVYNSVWPSGTWRRIIRRVRVER